MFDIYCINIHLLWGYKNMAELTDFQILQRDADGFARFDWTGTAPDPIPDDGSAVATRIVREDDGLAITYWEGCEMDGQNWTAHLTIPEGGLYRIEAAVHKPGTYPWINRIACVYHIGVGDIYVTCGQSNMTGYGRDSAYDPPTLGVHSLMNRGGWSIATHPLSEAIGSIYGYPENATGTSPALSFARRLHERLGVPIGIVPTAVGGTPISFWSPLEEGGCYREMERRIEKVGNFRGYIWLQGCSDCEEKLASTYFERFSAMIDAWNEKFGKHPIITAQLNRNTNCDNIIEKDRAWGMIRDAQRRAALMLDDVYVVSTTDLPVTDGIHNSSGANVIIGERMANCALAEIYKKPGQTAAAILSAEYVDDTHVMLHLTPGHHVYAMDDLAQGMNVEDADGIAECGRVSAGGDTLTISTNRPYTLPAKFHYTWRSEPPVFVLRDLYDMPLLSCYGVEITK